MNIYKLLVFFVFLIFLRVFFFEVYEVSQNSMQNTFSAGVKVGVQKSFYEVSHNDILVFCKSKPMIKRCIGLPGDTIIILNDETIVNGNFHVRPNTVNIECSNLHFDVPSLSFIFYTYGNNWDLKNFGPYVIPRKKMTIQITKRSLAMYQHIIKKEISPRSFDNLGSSYTFKNDYYFLIGDNRYHSEDSRMFGPVSKTELIGKVIVRF